MTERPLPHNRNAEVRIILLGRKSRYRVENIIARRYRRFVKQISSRKKNSETP